MIQYFKSERLKGWWDIAQDGKRVGYIVKQEHFYQVTVNGKEKNRLALLESWTTLEAAKKRAEETLEDVAEEGDIVKVSDEWEEVIE